MNARGGGPARWPGRTWIGAAILTTAAGLLASPVPAVAQDTPRGPSTGVTERLTADAVQTFADSVIPAEMSSRHVPGAVFVFVRDGEVAVTRGYGRADLEAGTPMDPDSTVLRFGSLSKLVTATAAMRLVQEGRLSLTADVNRYLDRFRVPDTYPEPVTLFGLLTHTSGLDDHLFGQYARGESGFEPLGEYLAERGWHRWQPPGRAIIYSDHGMSLAGYLVEKVSGRPFADYADQAVFEPLGMTGSTFRQPPPPGVRRRLATGYAWEGDGYRTYPYALIQTSPSVALQGTAADMGRFMVAHLGGAASGEESVLTDESRRRMHRTRFRHHPGLEGRALGFSTIRVAGHRGIYHDGSTSGFTSRLVLVPQLDFGFLVAYNHEFYGPGGEARPGGRLKSAVTRAFEERFFPGYEMAHEPLDRGRCGPGEEPRPEGAFRELTLSPYTLEKVALLTRQTRVRPVEGCRIEVGDIAYARLDSLLYGWSEEWRPRVAFGRGSGGDLDYLFVGNSAHERLPWHQTVAVQGGIAGLFVLVFLGLAATPPISYLGRRRADAPTADLLRPFRWTGAATGVLNIAFLAGVASVLFTAELNRLFYGPPPMLEALLWIPFLTGSLSVATLAGTLRLARKPGRTSAETLWLIAGGSAGLLFLLFLHQWQLLGFQY